MSHAGEYKLHPADRRPVIPYISAAKIEGMRAVRNDGSMLLLLCIVEDATEVHYRLL